MTLDEGMDKTVVVVEFGKVESEKSTMLVGRDRVPVVLASVEVLVE